MVHSFYYIRFNTDSHSQLQPNLAHYENIIFPNYADKFVQHKAVRKQPNSMKARRIYVQKGQTGAIRVLFIAVIELTVVVFEDKCGFE